MKIYILIRTLLVTNNLLSAGIRGFFYLFFLLVFCFLGVHIILLARVGWLQQTKKDASAHSSEDETKNKAPAQSQEPIYYIVERKTKRAKTSYGEPKQFRFK